MCKNIFLCSICFQNLFGLIIFIDFIKVFICSFFLLLLIDLFGIIVPTLRVAIKAIYRSGILNPFAFRLNTYEATIMRQKVLKGLCQSNKSEINLFMALKSEEMTNITKQNKIICNGIAIIIIN